MEIDLPVPLGIGGERQIDAGQLPGHVGLEHPGVIGRCGLAPGVPPPHRLVPEIPIRRLPLPPLVVLRTLKGKVLGGGCVKEEGHERIPPAVLVHGGRSMPDPLPGHEHGHGAVELELHHLGGGRVPVAPQVADESPRRRLLPRAVAVADPGGALHVLVGAHVVDQGHEAVVQDGEVAAQNLLGGGHGGALGLHGCGAAEARGVGSGWTRRVTGTQRSGIKGARSAGATISDSPTCWPKSCAPGGPARGSFRSPRNRRGIPILPPPGEVPHREPRNAGGVPVLPGSWQRLGP